MLSWLAYNALVALPLALVARLAERPLRHRPGALHLLWLLVLLRLVAPPVPARETGAPGTTPPSDLLDSTGDSTLVSAVAWMTRTFGNDWSNALYRGFLGLFLAGVAWMLVREARNALRVHRALARAQEAPAELVRTTRRLAARMGVRPPAVRILPGARGPFLWSMRKRILVLPDARPAPTLLVHELAHLRRRDHWVGRLELVLLALLWWNPLFWWARRRLGITAELACDAHVVQRFPDQRHDYATALVDVVAGGDGRPLPGAPHAVGLGARDLEARLRHVLGGRDDARIAPAWVAALLGLLVLSLPGVGAPSLEAFRRALPAIPAGLDSHHWEAQLEHSLEFPPDGPELDRRAIALMGLGRLEEARDVLLAQIEVGFDVPRAHYNLACAHALLGERDAALDHLELAFEAGFPHRAFLGQDGDLASLRGDPRFEALRED